MLARILAARGAHVTGIDLSPRLIELAREQDGDGAIDYRVADLSQPLPELDSRFDLIGSYLVLNDVQDYRGFASTLAALAKPGGRLVLAFNNPYSSVVRAHIADYFASGTLGIYGGLAQQGIPAKCFQRVFAASVLATDGAVAAAKLAGAGEHSCRIYIVEAFSYYHRTLEEYLDAFLDAGFRLRKLADVLDVFGLEWVLPKQYRFPRFMVLAFEKA